ncbi:MAG: response regulator [Bacteroidia bacterium]|nr:response regulator [Bacteroidia bacterium]
MHSFLQALPNTFALVCSTDGAILSYSNWFVTQDFKQNEMSSLTTLITHFDERLFANFVNNNDKYIAEIWVKKQRVFLELKLEILADGNYLLLSNDVTELKSTQQELDFVSKISELNVNRLHKTLVQLEESNNKLLESKLSKEQMMAHMSHEVRSPLNVISGFTTLLAQTSLTTEQAEYAQAIAFASNNLLDLANSILDFSKLEAGKYSVNKTKVNVGELIKSTITAFTLKAKEKNIAIVFENELPTNSLYWIDVMHYTQIIINLLSNAIKFTQHGNVLITVHYHDQNLITKIKDSGIGIKKEHQETIFENFAQVPNSPYNRLGTGLGLTIVKQLVVLNNGTIDVQSMSNDGATFTVNIPTNQTIEKIIIKDVNTLNITLENYHILVVEDQLLNQKLIQRILTNNKAKVSIASNGEEAITAFTDARNTFNCILMDINMPVMDGIQATQLLRTLHNCNLPILCLTADASPAVHTQVAQAGANGVITKPFEIEKIMMAIIEQNKCYVSLKYFADLATNDTNFMDELLEVCTTSIKKERAEFISAYTTHNWQELMSAIHKLKGSTCMFYCPKFDEVVSVINTKINERTLTQLEFTQFLEKLNSFMCSVATKIKEQ